MTFQQVFDGSIERTDKQILCYLLVFMVCYALMSVSNLCRLMDQLYFTNQLSLAAYLLQDFFCIGYLACIHQMNYSGLNDRTQSVDIQNLE